VIVLALGALVVTLGMSIYSQFLFLSLPRFFGSLSVAYWGGDPSIWFGSFIAMAILWPLTGWLSDRYGRKMFIVLAFFAFSLLAFLYPIMVVFPLVYVTSLGGFLSSMYRPAYNALLADSVETRRRGVAFGTTSGILYIGSLAAPTVGSALFSAWGFSGVFYASGLIMLSGAVLCLLLLAEPAQARVIRESHLGDYGSGRETARGRDPEEASRKGNANSVKSVPGLVNGNWIKVIITLIAISILLSSISISFRLAFSSLVFSYMGSGFIQIVEVWIVLLSLFSLVVGGVLADRWGRRKTLLNILKLGIALSLVFSVGLVASYLWFFVGMMSLVTFLGSAFSPVVYALVSDITPFSRRGLAYGLLILGVGVGQTVMFMLIGVLLPASIGLNGIPVLFALVFVFIIMATILSILGVEEPEMAF
jgi:MFS family permease